MITLNDCGIINHHGYRDFGFTINPIQLTVTPDKLTGATFKLKLASDRVTDDIVVTALSTAVATHMRISESPNFNAVPWVDYADSTGFTLSPGEGRKNIYAQFRNDLPAPYRRYAMGPVWRNEKPGPGRYRQFYQCDADTVGSGSVAADAEILQRARGLRAVIAVGGNLDFTHRVGFGPVVHGLPSAVHQPSLASSLHDGVRSASPGRIRPVSRAGKTRTPCYIGGDGSTEGERR